MRIGVSSLCNLKLLQGLKELGIHSELEDDPKPEKDEMLMDFLFSKKQFHLGMALYGCLCRQND